MMFCHLLFFQNHFFENSFRNLTRVSNSLDPDQDQHSAGPDLGPNCLKDYQQMTKVATSQERVNVLVHPSSSGKKVTY